MEWGDAKAARAGAESPTVQATGGGETLDQSLVAATFAAGNWHTAEGRMGCVRGVRRTVVGHVSVNAGRQPRGPHDTLYIGDEAAHGSGAVPGVRPRRGKVVLVWHRAGFNVWGLAFGV